MPQQSIKQIQRIGRTGRKRDGIVHVLMTEGREDGNWEKAQQTHRDIQREILLNANLELFEDVERLLPPGDLPTCVEKEMPVDAWDPGAKGKRKQLAGASKLKAKRAPVMAVPEGAEGFKSVSAWLKEGTKGKRGKNSGLRDYDDEDSEGDGEQGSSGKTKSDRPRKARKSDKPKTAAELAAEAAAEKAAAAERERQEREELDNEAIDFFNTQGLVRAPPPGLFDSPPARSPSQASSSGIVWTPSPKRADHALPAESPSKSSPFKSPAQPNGKPNGTPLFQPTIDLSLDDDDEDIFKEEPPAPKASTLDKSMPPPPLPTKSSPYSPKVATPLSRPAQLVPASTPMTDSTEPTPFPVRTRRRIGIVGSSPDMSPAQSLQRLRRRGEAIVAAQDDSSPVAMRRRRKRLRGAYADHEMVSFYIVCGGANSSLTLMPLYLAARRLGTNPRAARTRRTACLRAILLPRKRPVGTTSTQFMQRVSVPKHALVPGSSSTATARPSVPRFSARRARLCCSATTSATASVTRRTSTRSAALCATTRTSRLPVS